MSTPSPFADFLNALAARLEIARWGGYHLDTLTPEVAHASAMLLLLAMRGDLNRSVIRKLPTLLDGKTQVLREALAYLEKVKPDDAIEAITACLDTEQLAFVLMQAQDVMLDVDQPTEQEQLMFDRLRDAYDGSSALLSTSLLTLKHKNALSSLGPFEPPEAALKSTSINRAEVMSPPQVLAESLLRIMVADGVVDPQQMAYVGHVVQRFPGLQELAVQQARKVTTDQFLLKVRGMLTPNQALCVLCQSAQLIFVEGRGSQPKWQVFRQLRDAWGLSERDMVIHLGTLKFNASKLLSRRDENAQPSAWGMRQDDWAAMKNGQPRPAGRNQTMGRAEEGTVIRHGSDAGPSPVQQRPRGTTAVHRGPVQAPPARAVASSARPASASPSVASAAPAAVKPTKAAPVAPSAPPASASPARGLQKKQPGSSTASAVESPVEQPVAASTAETVPDEAGTVENASAPLQDVDQALENSADESSEPTFASNVAPEVEESPVALSAEPEQNEVPAQSPTSQSDDSVAQEPPSDAKAPTSSEVPPPGPTAAAPTLAPTLAPTPAPTGAATPPPSSAPSAASATAATPSTAPVSAPTAAPSQPPASSPAPSAGPSQANASGSQPDADTPSATTAEPANPKSAKPVPQGKADVPASTQAEPQADRAPARHEAARESAQSKPVEAGQAPSPKSGQASAKAPVPVSPEISAEPSQTLNPLSSCDPQALEANEPNDNHQSVVSEQPVDNVVSLDADRLNDEIQRDATESLSDDTHAMDKDTCQDPLANEASTAMEDEFVSTSDDQSDHRMAMADEPVDDHAETLADTTEQENRQTLDESLDADNRASLPSDDKVSDNRQCLSPDTDFDHQELLPPQPPSQRAFEQAPLREAEKVLNRFFETWQNTAEQEPVAVRKKAGFQSQIPPTIHRQRVIDFSSLNIYLDYPQEDVSATDEESEEFPSPTTRRDYDYKLQTCLDILKRQQDMVNDKLQRIRERR